MTDSRGLRCGNRQITRSVIIITCRYLHRERIINITLGNGKGQIATLGDIDGIITSCDISTAQGAGGVI